MQKEKDTSILKWKHTLNDGYIPITNLSDLNKEMDKKEVKKIKDFKTFEDFEGNLLVEDINKESAKKFVDEETKQKHELKGIMMCKSLNKYVQLKRFEKDTLKYNCRIMEKDSKKEETQDIDQDDLTKDITVVVKKISSQVLGEGADEDTLTLQVNINDKLSKIT